MEMRFCRRCGAGLEQINGHVYRCTAGHTIFANAAPTVAVFFMVGDNKVMLAVRAEEPHKGMLDAIGGFLDGQETIEAAAERELREELGLEPHEYEPLRYLSSGTDIYPYGGEDIPFATAIYWSRLLTDRQPQPADDVAALQIEDLHSLDLTLLHTEDIRHGIRRLRELFPPS
jgi:ADP-ribose pyrophosphatase YjhB (NUDIX family)